MPVQVPQITPQQHQASPIVSAVIQSILWPMKMQAQQEATLARQQGYADTEKEQSASALDEMIKGASVQNAGQAGISAASDVANQPIPQSKTLSSMGASKPPLPNLPGTTESTPSTPTLGAAPEYPELSKVLQAGSQAEDSARNAIPDVPRGFAPGVYGQMAINYATQHPETLGGVGHPNLVTTTTSEGNQVLAPKTAGTVVSTPQGTLANKAAQGNMPALFVQAFRRDNPQATDMDTFKAWQDTQLAIQKERGLSFGAGRYYPTTDPATGEPTWMRGADIQSLRQQGKNAVPPQFNPAIKQAMTEAGQRGGATTANVNDARNTYAAAVPTMIGLRDKIAEKGLLPTGGFKDINALNLWVMDHLSDPDVAALGTKAGMMREALSRALGSTQGGEYMLKFASTLLNPSYSPEAFTRVVGEHMATLNTKLKARREFGINPALESSGFENQNPGAAPTSAPFAPLPGETYDEYTKRAAAAGVK